MNHTGSFMQVDVFSESVGSGNPLPVFFDCDQLDATTMQTVAGWLNYSETVFLQSSAVADHKIRIFTIDREMEFAGHPIMGATFAILEQEGWTRHQIELETQIGCVEVVADDSKKIHFKVPSMNTLAPCLIVEEASRLIGVAAHHPLPIQIGITWLTMRVDDLTALYDVQVDPQHLEEVSHEHKLEGIGIYAFDGQGQVHVRNLFTVAGRLIEDPVCGSGNACVAEHIRTTQALPSNLLGYRAFQGKMLGRDGRLEVEFRKQDIYLIGNCQQVINGYSEVSKSH